MDSGPWGEPRLGLLDNERAEMGIELQAP